MAKHQTNPGGTIGSVDHPDHYQTSTELEAIDVIEAFFHDSFHLGNVFKYIARAGRKGDYVEDLQKAAWYLQRKIDRHASADERLDRAAKEMAGMPIISRNPRKD